MRNARARRDDDSDPIPKLRIATARNRPCRASSRTSPRGAAEAETRSDDEVRRGDRPLRSPNIRSRATATNSRVPRLPLILPHVETPCVARHGPAPPRELPGPSNVRHCGYLSSTQLPR